jgi:hypothetical protein
MRPNATIASVLIFALLAGPAGAQQQTPPVTQTPPPTQTPRPTQAPATPTEPASAQQLNRIRDAVGREPALHVENGQLKIYVEVIGNWPSFADVTKGYDFINGPTGYGNPMSHKEFLEMTTPKDMYSTAGIQPAEILTMSAVNAVGQWAIVKALTKISNSRKDKQLRDIRAQIDADLAAIKKEK